MGGFGLNMPQLDSGIITNHHLKQKIGIFPDDFTDRVTISIGISGELMA
jgi:hypothetical protein